MSNPFIYLTTFTLQEKCNNTCKNYLDPKWRNILSCHSQICLTPIPWVVAASSCKDFLTSKECDCECKLCSCTTGDEKKKEHCNNRGECAATCKRETCNGARCVCYPGFTGDKCDQIGTTLH